MKVFVYWNLHKKCWSLRDCATRKVVQHRQSLTLIDCQFKVSEAGRQRVLKERRKNVHAGVAGELMVPEPESPGLGSPVRYNPYEMDRFQVCGKPVTAGEVVHFYPDRSVRVAGKVIYD